MPRRSIAVQIIFPVFFIFLLSSLILITYLNISYPVPLWEQYRIPLIILCVITACNPLSPYELFTAGLLFICIILVCSRICLPNKNRALKKERQHPSMVLPPQNTNPVLIHYRSRRNLPENNHTVKICGRNHRLCIKHFRNLLPACNPHIQ